MRRREVHGRDESLPYGWTVKMELTVGCGPGMPGPYGVVWIVMHERGKGGRQPSPFPVDGW